MRHALLHFMKPGDDWDDDFEIGDDNNDGAILSPWPTTLLPLASYQVLTEADLEAQRQNLIGHVADSLAVELDHAESLLCSHRWRSSDLIDSYLTSEATEDDGVDVVVCGHFTAPALVSIDALVECQTAFCGQYPRSQTTILSCGHVFCNDCWRS